MSDDLEADLADALENLLDGTHTPFVHAGLLRSSGSGQAFTATVRRRDEFVEAEYRGEPGQSGLISRWFEPQREVSFGRFVPPCTAELEYRSRRRLELLVVARFTPSTTGRLRVFVTCYLPGDLLPAAVRFAVVRPFFGQVLKQDRKILRLQQQNIARFGQRAYTGWTADLLRPWIDAWLRDGRFPDQRDGPQDVRFVL
jgi:phenylpropionate dioxygenase-like ring-hydroxylating dioxygenase large terminal subunit